jgi:hypothetical protein
MEQLSPIEIKSRINQEVDSGFKVVLSTILHNREAIKSNASHHSIFERAREKTKRK